MVDSITDRHIAEQAFKVALLTELNQPILPEVCYSADDDAFIERFVTNNEYKDQNTGRIIAPASVREAKKRSDWPMWEKAIDKEVSALKQLGVYSEGHTRDDLLKMGINQSPVPMRMVLTVKYDDKGNFIKAKARLCIAGHPGVMHKGVHYFSTFAATPRTDTARILSAIAVRMNYHRTACDINNAFCQAECKDYEKIPLRPPSGMEQTNEQGDVLFLVLQRNLYGSPAAPRRFMQARNTWLLEKFNQDGWTCRKCLYDPCLFKFVSPQGKWTFMLVHVDDCTMVGESKADSALITAAFADKFTITVVDPGYMLGIRSDLYEKDGVRYLELTQEEYIENLVKQFSEQIKKHVSSRRMNNGYVKEPVPVGTFFSVAGDPDKGILPPDEADVKQYLADGYQSAVGSLNWPARHCYPEISAGVHQLCRLMTTPTKEAYAAAMQMICYLDGQKSRGIRFDSKSSEKPVCYYDSSSKKDPKDSHAQYGYVIFLCGGPVMWQSKKHNHAGRSTTDDEYMALGHATTAVMWLRSLLFEMGFGDWVSEPTAMMGDNDQTTNIANEDYISSATRYFRLEYHFCKECKESGDIQPLRVATENNYSDLLTKCLAGPQLEKLRPGLTGYEQLPQPPAAPRD